jgi:hypothetical protein
MTIFQDILTEYDETLSGETYLDPIGALVIWSAFGQQIFRNRVNSISNDVRNYTLNLVNHYLVRRLETDPQAKLSDRLARVYPDKREQSFKYACLLHLENLFAFAILQHEGDTGVESGGVLGIRKARRLWEDSQHNPTLRFTHDKEGQVLVRQLGLGVSGRYKTPLMEIGYFDSHYHYHLPDAAGLWARTEILVQDTPELSAFVEQAYAYLKTVLLQSRKCPEVTFKEVPAALKKAFVSAFSAPEKVGLYTRDYWLAVTGLNTGAAGAILQVLDDYRDKPELEALTPEELVALAMGKPLAADDQTRLRNIQILEPFLGESALLFTIMTARRSQPLETVLSEWKRFGRHASTLPGAARQVLATPAIINVVSGTARSRLQRLLKLTDAETVEGQVRVLFDYHRQVMIERGQLPWLSLDDEGLIKVNVRPSYLPDPEDWPAAHWVNGYYLPQFRKLVMGYQGGEA